MLVLTRKREQTLVIGDDIEVTVLDIQGDQIRLGVKAPKSVKVYRKELYLEIQEENKSAARASAPHVPPAIKDLLKGGPIGERNAPAAGAGNAAAEHGAAGTGNADGTARATGERRAVNTADAGERTAAANTTDERNVAAETGAGNA